VHDRRGQIFDAGVGTGILGEILSILGYRNLSGVDMSDGMLAKARARNVYGDLRNRVLGEALDFETGSVAVVVSTGVLTTGHAPPSALDELVRITRSGGYLIFNISTSAWNENGFKEKVGAFEKLGLIRSVESTGAYRPMPLSPTEGEFTTQAFVYQRS
jgi:SAM-dependent methyltransferase